MEIARETQDCDGMFAVFLVEISTLPSHRRVRQMESTRRFNLIEGSRTATYTFSLQHRIDINPHLNSLSTLREKKFYFHFFFLLQHRQAFFCCVSFS